MAFIRSGGFRILVFLTVFAAFGTGVLATGFYLSLVSDLPDLETIEDYGPPLTSRVLDRKGRVIAEFSSERRRLARLDEIPEYARLAFVAAEDSGFYEHGGLDYVSILRAALANLRAGEVEQGASTITQQTVKGLLLTPERTFRRKFREMILARKIEQHLTKDEILYLYLNQIYFGYGAWGIAEAALTYFDKDVSDLTVSEAALLAGLPQRPNSWQPYRNPEAADKRRRYVLKRMLEDEIIDEPTYDEALAEVPEPTPPSYREHFADSEYFTELVRQDLFERFGGDRVLNGGLVVETTIDLDLQLAAVAAVQAGLEAHDHRAGYRGPLRRVAKAEIPAEIEKLALENELLPPAPEPVVEPDPEDATETEPAPRETPPAVSTGPETEAGSETEAGPEEETLAAEPPADAADGESEALPEEIELPYETRLVGVVTAVDRKHDTARIAFAPGLEGEVALDDVSWAREPDPKRRPRPVTDIERIFETGDVATFVRLERPEEAADDESGKDEEEGEPPLARVTLDQDPLAQAGLLSIENQTGDVLALVGGYDYAKSEFNRVTQAVRQPGSAFKPFIYGAALAQGYSPVDTLYDRPVVYEDPISGFKYKPENYERRFFGPIPMRFALAHSINNATVHLFRDVGVDYVIDYARRLGIQSHLERDLSLAIGSSGVTLLELTSAYAVFPNAGRRIVPRFISKVTDRDGQTLLENIPLGSPSPPALRPLAEQGSEPPAAYPDAEILPTDQIISEEVAYLMCDLLKAVVNEGTGRRLKALGRPLAGKTGTTNEFGDAWFMGFSPDVTTGVWVGHDQPATRLGWGESGAKAALPIWKDYMEVALAARSVRDFDVPDHIEFARIDRATGLIADANSQDVYFQPFLEGHVPTRTAGDVSQTTDTERALRSDAF